MHYEYYDMTENEARLHREQQRAADKNEMNISDKRLKQDYFSSDKNEEEEERKEQRKRRKKYKQKRKPHKSQNSHHQLNQATSNSIGNFFLSFSILLFL